ncbi:MAG: DUF4258 domain-containing protein [Oligoflexia bacterium]|nr:DUF4258 domain-containing protein [Oligoflexia bacterium]
MNIVYRIHAVRRMFERDISEEEVLRVLTSGKIIEDYPADEPFPSCLKLAFCESRPIHVVVAEDSTQDSLIVITAYEPDLTYWQPGFEQRRK